MRQKRDGRITLRAHWEGRDPEHGDFLKSRRGRTAYLIDQVRPASGEHRLTLKCWRWPAVELPQGARVHEWVWDKR